MALRKSTKSPATAPAPLVVPATKPRNRIAVDPLLKKSAVHADKRLRCKLDESSKDVADALKSARQHSEGE